VAEQATERMTVSATPERCFAVSADIAAYPEWAADIKEVAIDEVDDQGRPAVVTFRAAAFGRSTSYTLAYDYSEAPGVLSWVQTQGDITSKLDGRYVFAPDGPAPRIHQDAGAESHHVHRPPGVTGSGRSRRVIRGGRSGPS